MAIRVEQLDMNNISKYFMLKKELKPMLTELIASMTLDEKIELGLVTLPFEVGRLRELIKECEDKLYRAVVGASVGQYYQVVVDEFKMELDRCKDLYDEIGSRDSDLEQANWVYDELTFAKDKFLAQAVRPDGVLIDTTWYGESRPTDPSYTWIPVKQFDEKYWVSVYPVTPYHPYYAKMVQFYGVYNPDTNTIYSRFDVPATFGSVSRVDGALWNDTWFGENAEDVNRLNEYFGKDFDYVKSSFRYTEAVPPVVLESGFVWIGEDDDLEKVPQDREELKRVMNAVAAIATDKDGDFPVPATPSILVNGTWYGEDKPSDKAAAWTPVSVINGIYISPKDMPADYPGSAGLTQIYGLFNPITKKIHTRFELPSELAEYTKSEGMLYNDVWFSQNDDAADLALYLNREIYFVQSSYQYVDAQPPTIPESGDAIYLGAGYVEFLPGTVSELKRLFNCVVAIGQ